MKPLIFSLIKRNAIVVLALMILLMGFRLMPAGYTPTWLFMAIALLYFGGLLFANSVLTKRGHPFLGILLSLLFVPIFGYPSTIASIVLGRILVERRYTAQGFQMIEGCNGGAANQADDQVRTIERRLQDFKGISNVGTNKIVQLQKAYVIAQEKALVLRNDCRNRGHRHTKPWKTNWATINQVLTATEE